MQRYAMRLKRVLGRFAIEVEVETEDGGRRVDVIPRIKMQPKDDEYPYGWTRTQFPVRLAFAMTVNKSQGQTIRGRVGLYLPDPVFGHGQLYVASSRTTDRRNLRLCIPAGEHLAFGAAPSEPNAGKITVNVVYHEVL